MQSQIDLLKEHNVAQDRRADNMEERQGVVDTRLTSTERKVDDLVASSGKDNLEVVEARGEFGKLSARLDASDVKDTEQDTELESLDTRVKTWEDFKTIGGELPKLSVTSGGSIDKSDYDWTFRATNDKNIKFSTWHSGSPGVETNVLLTLNAFRPTGASGVVTLGTLSNRFGTVYGTTGDFSGTEINSYQYKVASGVWTLNLKGGSTASGNPTLIFQSDSNVGNIPTFRPEGNSTHYLGHVSHRWGTIYSVNPLNTSDSSYKENIKSVQMEPMSLDEQSYSDKVHEFMKTMPLYTFDYKNTSDGAHQMGFLADELLELNPEIASNFVYDVEDGAMTSTHAYVSTLHLAFQEEVKKREALEQRVEQLEKLVLK